MPSISASNPDAADDHHPAARLETIPDTPNFSWVDYGLRCGPPRMIALFIERKLPVATSFNAGVIAWVALVEHAPDSWDTLDLLKSCGIEYCHDWMIEDVPVWLTTNQGPIVGMPYNLEVNDGVIYAVQRAPTDEMYKRLVRTVECFEREAVHQTRTCRSACIRI